MSSAAAPTTSPRAASRPRRTPPTPDMRLSILSRVLAAVFGGYLLAALGAVLMARGLPIVQTEATGAATLFSFVSYTGAVMWVFAARTAARAWLGLAAPTALILALLLLIDGAAR